MQADREAGALAEGRMWRHLMGKHKKGKLEMRLKRLTDKPPVIVLPRIGFNLWQHF